MVENLEQLERQIQHAKIYAASSLVPAHFRGKWEDVLVAIQIGATLRMAPYFILQSIYVLQGKACLSGQLCIALLNNSGRIKGPLKYKVEHGEDLQRLAVVAQAIDAAAGTVIHVRVSMEQARVAGWARGPLYRSIPEHMLRYRAAQFLIRTHYPEVLYGLDITELATNDNVALSVVVQE